VRQFSIEFLFHLSRGGEALMGFDTIICNGSVVTATDTYVADVAITDARSQRSARTFLDRTPRRYWTLR